MAYKIQYTPEDNARYPKMKNSKTIPWKRWLFAIAIFAAVLWVREKGVPDFIIPGDPEVTTAATKNMISNLQEGAKVNEAVTVFCKEILNGAGF